MPKAQRADEARVFTDIPNVGPAMSRDLARLGYTRPGDLAGEDPLAMYDRLSALTKSRQDPCVLDTFMAVVDFMNGGAARPWWDFTAERKKKHPDV